MKNSLEHPTSAATLPDQERDRAPNQIERLSMPPVTDADILAYLRHSAQLAEIATLAEQDAMVVATCKHFGISVTDAELQTAGDAFRTEHKLLGSAETFGWLTQQQISVEDWTEGIRISLLTRKLKEHLFGAAVDGTYLSDRDNYRRVALSQILVRDLSTAMQVTETLREGASFPALALTYSKGKQSQENGGFVGVRFLVELLPEIATALGDANEGDVIGPVQTRLGFHVLRVEKWFPTELSESVREQILDALFQIWLQEQHSVK